MTNLNTLPTRAELEKYRKKPNDGPLHILLFYILPFVVFNSILFVLVTAAPKISLEIADTNDYLTTQAQLTLKSWFPIKSITANLDGVELDLGKPHKRTYTVTITKNGLLEASVVNMNGMKTAQFEHIDILDDNPPAIENAQVDEGVVTLTVIDSQSGVNFDSIYAVDSSGNQVLPITADRQSNTLSFPIDPEGLLVNAQDRAGNEVQGTFTSHKEGEDEVLDSSISDISQEED